MKEIEIIKLKFLIGCIGIRTLFVIITKNINKDYLPYIGYIGLLISISFVYQFITKKRIVGAFNNKVWWDKLRPIHAINYGLFAYMAINKSSHAWIPLLIDVIIGLSAHLYYHKSQGNI